MKFLGILVFIGILSRIDRASLFSHLQNAEITFIVFAVMTLIIIYSLKTLRWHILVRSGGALVSLRESWRTYLIGFFLGVLTPGKIGELGRSAYLVREGMAMVTALWITVLDRFTDAVMILVLALASIAVLYGIPMASMVTILFVLPVVILIFTWGRWRRFFKKFPLLTLNTASIASIVALTVLSWILHILWGVFLARSIGLSLPLIPFAAALILGSVIAFLPIAPSGLGTRDAALLTFLTPLGADNERIVALSFLMFLTILAANTLGGWYWICDRGVKRMEKETHGTGRG